MQRAHTERRRPASHSQTCPSLVARSIQFGASDHRDRAQGSQPRRPNTTPKPRIQRLLTGPGISAAQDWNISRQSMPSTLLRLPDSPPRLISVQSSTEHMDTPIERNPACRDLSSQGIDVQLLVIPDIPTESRSHFQSDAVILDDTEEEDEQVKDCLDAVVVTGPLLTDLEAIQDLNDEMDEENDYKQVLAHRKQLLNDEANRQSIREELEAYVVSLSLRTDENGEHLVEFPRNYQQIVLLMTQKDVSDEDTKSQEGNDTRQSWSRVLIESGLSKQQAFGVLDDVDDDPEGSSGLAAKIAFKMARIRQLDAILEEKLGPNLYSNIVTRKQKRTHSPPQVQRTHDNICRTGSIKSSSRTLMTQLQSVTLSTGSNGGETSRSSIRTSGVDGESATEVKKSCYFIERNKQMVANGMKANMTKDEEKRLEKLLLDETGTSSNGLASEENTRLEAEVPLEACNEFIMTKDEKKAIEELIATKSGAYPLVAIDELHDGPTDEALAPSVKENRLQETRRERIQRQRLNRVEQELRFLQECPSVVIVGDDNDEDEDCRSERSYATGASSTCSTRSGVISRHDFKCFLAQQKESFRSAPIASADEIRRLLLSIGHGTSVSSNVVTATTG